MNLIQKKDKESPERNQQNSGMIQPQRVEQRRAGSIQEEREGSRPSERNLMAPEANTEPIDIIL